MSESDDGRSEGTPDEAKPANEAPPSKPGGSVFDSPWGGVGSKPVFTPPSISSFAPPRTSGTGAVSGEIGESAAKQDDEQQPSEAAEPDDKPAEAAQSDAAPEEKPVEAAEPDEKPAEAAKSDEAPAEPDDADPGPTESVDEPDDPPTDTRHADIDPPRPRPSQPAEPSSPTSPWLIIAVVVGILLAIWYVSNARDSHEAGEGPSKPNHAAKSPSDTPEPQPGPQPQPRSRVVTHTKDAPPQPATDEPATEPTSDGGEVEPPPEPVVEPPPEPVVEPPPEPDPQPDPQPRPSVDNPRDPSLIPAGTPAENAKAFSKLPVAPSDGPPIGGIGRSGIHIDEVAMGQGRDNVSCEQPTRAFTTTGTEFVNVCFRVVHPRASETLRVYWEKDGTVTRRGKVRIPENLHAYKTRAYLQVRPEYVGKWRVRIVPEGEDDTDLAVVEFEITN